MVLVIKKFTKDVGWTVILNLCQRRIGFEIQKNIPTCVIEKGREQMSKILLFQKMQLGLKKLKLEIYDHFPSIICFKSEDFDIEVSLDMLVE